MLQIKFIKKANEIHKNKYDYSEVDYINCKTLVKIKCKNHNNMFDVTPRQHLYGFSGCNKCKKVPTYTTNNWIEKAKKVHGDKYDYSKTIYVNSTIKVKIICKEHGDFEQIPYSHLKTIECCPKCQIRSKDTKEDWIKKAKKVYGNK